MKDYKELLDYIMYFENEEIEFYKWESEYPTYDIKLDEFIKCTYKTDLLKGNYLDCLGERVKENDLPITQ